MYHTAALSHTAEMTGLAAYLKFNGIFLFNRVGGHNGSCSLSISRVGKLLCKLRNSPLNRFNGQHLTDNACGSNDDLLRLDAQSVSRKTAHLKSLFLAVSIAGVGVLGIYDNSLGSAARLFQIFLCNDNGSALYLVGGINTRRTAHNIGNDKCDVVFLSGIFLNGAVNAACLKAFSGTNAAVDNLKIHINDLLVFEIIFKLILCRGRVSRPETGLRSENAEYFIKRVSRHRQIIPAPCPHQFPS